MVSPCFALFPLQQQTSIRQPFTIICRQELCAPISSIRWCHPMCSQTRWVTVLEWNLSVQVGWDGFSIPMLCRYEFAAFQQVAGRNCLSVSRAGGYFHTLLCCFCLYASVCMGSERSASFSCDFWPFIAQSELCSVPGCSRPELLAGMLCPGAAACFAAAPPTSAVLCCVSSAGLSCMLACAQTRGWGKGLEEGWCIADPIWKMNRDLLLGLFHC